MSDKDSLPGAGIPFFSIVDENGVSTDGTSASMSLIRSRGMEPICEVSSVGVAASGSTLATLRQRGIQFYCPVDEDGVTSDAVTMNTLRYRGIPFFCPVGVDGVATDGTATIRQLAGRGIPYACILDALGGAGGSPGGSPYTMAAGAGSFILSGEAMIPLIDHRLVAEVAAFTLTGQDATFSYTPSYTGPGDVVSGATAWASPARAYSAAFAAGGTAIMDLQDQAGANPITINILSTGLVDVTAITNWVTANSVSTIRVAKLYDQTGNANHFTQATLANMPVLTLNLLNGLPGLTFAAGSGVLASPSITRAQPFSLSAVWIRTANNTTAMAAVGAASSAVSIGPHSTINTARANAGAGIDQTATDNSWHAHNAAFNSTSSGANVDGSDSGTVDGGTNTFASALRIGRSNGGVTMSGSVMEAGLWPSAFNATQRGNMNANQHGSSGYNF